MNGLVPNTTVDNLKNIFKNIDWPEGNFSEKVLYVKSGRYDGLPLTGRVLQSDEYGNPTEIFIVNRNNIYQFRNYLAIKHSNLTKEQEDKISRVANIFDITNPPKDILLDFLNNSSKYIDKVNEKVDLFHTLTNVANEVLDTPKKVYDTPIYNSIRDRLKYDKINKLYRISIDKFKALAQTYNVWNDDLSLEDNIDTILNGNNEIFGFTLVDQNSQSLVFKSGYNTAKFTIGYDTIKALKFEERYRGYNIYSYGNNYYYDKNIISTTSFGKKTSSLQEVYDNIDRIHQTKKYTLANSSNIEYMQTTNSTVTSKNYLPIGSTVQILNIDLSRYKKLNPEILQQNFDTLKASIQIDKSLQSRFNKVIDDAQKLAVYLTLTSKETPESVLDKIANTSYKYLYITGVSKINGKYHLITTPIRNEVENEESPKVPTYKFFNDMADVLHKKTGVDIKVLTSEELDELEDNYKGAKAFIQDNTININPNQASTSDMFHEFTHILIGMMKSQDLNQYNKFRDIIMSRVEGQRELIKIRELYPNRAEEDIQEEAIANLFGRYLADNKSIDDVFEQLRDESNNNLSKVLKLDDLDSQSIYNIPIDEVWDKLYTGLQNTNYDLGFAIKEGKKYRQASNFIEDGINKGLIDKRC